MTLLTQREAASLLRLSERTLERLRVFGLAQNSRGVVDQSAIASLILMSGLPRELLDQQAKNCKRSRCPSLGFVGTCPMLGSATF